MEYHSRRQRGAKMPESLNIRKVLGELVPDNIQYLEHTEAQVTPKKLSINRNEGVRWKPVTP